MKKPPLKFMLNEYIEDVTSQRLREYDLMQKQLTN